MPARFVSTRTVFFLFLLIIWDPSAASFSYAPICKAGRASGWKRECFFITSQYRQTLLFWHEIKKRGCCFVSNELLWNRLSFSLFGRRWRWRKSQLNKPSGKGKFWGSVVVEWIRNIVRFIIINAPAVPSPPLISIGRKKHVLVEANWCEFNFQLDPATCAISFQLLKQVQTVLMAMEARENVVRPRTIVIATGS